MAPSAGPTADVHKRHPQTAHAAPTRPRPRCRHCADVRRAELRWVGGGRPVVGALIVGVMARYGSAAIRGHGIPEVMERVLYNREPDLAEDHVPQAALRGDRDRHGRPIRRRGTDHRDGRRARLADRPVHSRHRRRAKDRCSPPAPRRAWRRRSAVRSPRCCSPSSCCCSSTAHARSFPSRWRRRSRRGVRALFAGSAPAFSDAAAACSRR